ncbi:MAG TPA: hypothetical protein VKA51_15480 [Rubrobacteraceae bacterium]|nr:hypothetical protein [Rubrobacteraceae bacterium]
MFRPRFHDSAREALSNVACVFVCAPLSSGASRTTMSSHEPSRVRQTARTSPSDERDSSHPSSPRAASATARASLAASTG